MMVAYRPDPRILELGPDFYDQVDPAPFPLQIPRFFNRRWAERVGLGTLDEAGQAAHFCRFEPLAQNLTKPLALRYHGHQFRSYNPDLGDGRGFLFAQLRDGNDRLLDLGTKGSGQTPWSRMGDGRLTLKGGVREVLATEMLEALGVSTSKTFALFETGEDLVRGDEPSPTRSSVLTRLSHGHIRIGSFQRLAFFNDRDNIAKLTRYCLGHLYGERSGNEDAENGLRLLERVTASTASLAASYLAAGFVHGVLNSDNIAITGESFDYGPWRFTPKWELGFTAAYFDHSGLYSFGRQPEAIQWDLAQLAGALTLISDREGLVEIFSTWGEQFEAALVRKLIDRLGVGPAEEEADRSLARALLEALQGGMVTIDRLFFDWRGGRDPGRDAYGEAFDPFRAAVSGRECLAAREHPYWNDADPCSMHIEEVEAIWAPIAERDDWSLFHAKIDQIRRMGDAFASGTGA